MRAMLRMGLLARLRYLLEVELNEDSKDDVADVNSAQRAAI